MTLELGKTGSTGTRGVTPVLRDGAVVATLRASKWREAAIAVVGDREWVFSKAHGVLRGRWEADPEDSSRMSARKSSFWRRTWLVDLDGTSVAVKNLSRWRGTHRYLVGEREIARSGRAGGLSPRPTLTADDSLSLDEQVFLLWMELVLLRRDQAATAAAAAGGAAAGGGSN